MSKSRELSSAFAALAPALVPSGGVVAFMKNSIPTGFLNCNGASISKTTYPELFAVIGYDYGGSADNFSLPDLRGEFLRGTDSGAAIDPDAATRTDRGDGTTGDVVGSKQPSEVLSHAHGGTFRILAGGGSTGYAAGANGKYDRSTSANGGNETRPRNVAVVYCIKY